MKIKVFLEREKQQKEIEVKNKATVKDLLKTLNINPVNILAAVNGEVCTEEEVLKDKDKLELFSVVSGG